MTSHVWSVFANTLLVILDLIEL